MIEAVIFDLDGLLLDSEPLWDEARERLTRDHGGTWTQSAQGDMMGMSSLEWSRYMHETLDVQLSPGEINDSVLSEMESLYRERLPLIDGAVEAVERLSRWRLGVASSSNRPLIDLALQESGLERLFEATVSSEEVDRGKPAPDVYLEAARRLGVEPGCCAAVEDSANGIRAAHAAGMRTIAVPNKDYPPASDALELADEVVPDLAGLEPSLLV